MEGKKKYIIAIILFIFLGLMIFTFANPSNDEDTSLDGKDKTKENVNKKDNAKDSEDTSDSDALNNDNTITNGSLTTNNSASRKTNTTTTTQTVATADTTYEEALKAVIDAEGKITQEALEHASGLVGQVTDEGKKQELEDRLEALDNSLEVRGLVEQLASQVKSAEDKGAMNNARSFRTNKGVAKRVGELKSPYEGLQKELQDTLNSLAKLLDDESAPKLNVADGAMFNKKNVPVTVSAEDENEVTITVKDEAGNEVEMPLEKDGKYTITAEDAAHNITEPSPITIEIDTLAPEFKTLGLLNLTNYVAKEGSLTYAKVGDQIRVYLEFSEKLGKEAKVVINGKEETLTYREPSSSEEASRYVYMADFTVDDAYAEGEVKFTITGYEDVAGNEGNKLTEEDINHKTYSGVIVDKTAAKRTAANMLVAGKSNEKDGPVYYASAESKIYTYVTFNEQLKENPTYVLINNGKEIDVTDKVKESKDEKTGKYTYSVTVPVSELTDFTDGEVTFKVSNIKDKAGNETADVTATTNGHKVIIDTTVPTIYAGGNKDEAILKDDVHYTNSKNANIEARDVNPFTITIKDSEGKEVKTLSYKYAPGKWSGERTDGTTWCNNPNDYAFRAGISHLIKEKEVYTIIATDGAGNKTEYKLVWDKTAPEATNVTISSANGSKSVGRTSVINIEATFDEELALDPVATIGGNTQDTLEKEVVEGKYVYRFTIHLPDGTGADGEKVPFTISNVKDQLGNIQDITETTDGSYLIIDRTASTVYVGTPKNNNGYESVEYNGVVYTRDKNVNVKDANPFTFVVKDTEGNVVSPAKGKTNAGEYNEKTKKYEFRKQIHVADGAYTVVVTDEAGNVQEYAYTLDTTIPEITTITVAEDGKTLIDEGKRIQLKDNTYYTYEIKNSEGKVVRDLKDKETKEVKYEQSGSMKLDYLPGGEYTITVTDIAGNVATKTFAIDKTPAKLTAANMLVAGKSNETDGPVYYANAESKINTYVTFNEQLKANPTYVLINNGKEIDVTDKVKESKDEKTGKYTYSVTVPVSELEGFSDGEVTFRVSNIKDKSGNDTADVTKTTNGHQVIIDITAPAVYVGSNKDEAILKEDVHYTNNNNSNVDVRDANPFTFVVTDSEGTEIFTSEGAAKNGEYYFRSGIAHLLKENKQYTIVATDAAGNKTEYKFVWDKTAPELTNYKIQKHTKKASGENALSENVHYATLNDEVMVTLEFNELIQGTPTIQINGHDVTYKSFSNPEQLKNGDYRYKFYNVVLSEDLNIEENSIIKVAVKDIKDELGNGPVEYTIDGTEKEFTVTYDSVKPTLAPADESNHFTKNPGFKPSDKNLEKVEVSKNGKVVKTYKDDDVIYDKRTESYMVFGSLEDLGVGEYTIAAYDKSGNKAEYTYVFDNTVPSVSGTVMINGEEKPFEEGGAYDGEVTLNVKDEFLASEKQWGKMDIKRVDKEGKTSNTTEMFGTDGQTTLSKTFKEEGIYTVVIYDMYGNKSTVTFTIDKSAPEVTATGKHKEIEGEFVNGNSYQKVSFTITDPNLSTDETKGQIIVKLNGKEQKTEEIPAGTSYKKDFTEEGNYEVTIQDIFGHSVVKKFRVDKTAPLYNYNKFVSKDTISIDQNVNPIEHIRSKLSDTYTAAPNLKISTNPEIDFENLNVAKVYDFSVEDEAGNVKNIQITLTITEALEDSNKIIISDADGLKALYESNANNNYKNKEVILTNDIDFKGEYWHPLNASDYNYKGLVINGNGHTIKNMKMSETESSVLYGKTTHLLGFIGYNYNSNIKISNITFDNVSIIVKNEGQGAVYAGIVMGLSSNATSPITNVKVTNSNITITQPMEQYFFATRESGGIIGHVEQSGDSIQFSKCVVENTNIIVNGSSYNNNIAGSFVGGTKNNAKIDVMSSQAVNVNVNNKTKKADYWIGGSANLTLTNAYESNVQNTNKDARTN